MTWHMIQTILHIFTFYQRYSQQSLKQRAHARHAQRHSKHNRHQKPFTDACRDDFCAHHKTRRACVGVVRQKPPCTSERGQKLRAIDHYYYPSDLINRQRINFVSSALKRNNVNRNHRPAFIRSATLKKKHWPTDEWTNRPTYCKHSLLTTGPAKEFGSPIRTAVSYWSHRHSIKSSNPTNFTVKNKTTRGPAVGELLCSPA